MINVDMFYGDEESYMKRNPKIKELVKEATQIIRSKHPDKRIGKQSYHTRKAYVHKAKPLTELQGEELIKNSDMLFAMFADELYLNFKSKINLTSNQKQKLNIRYKKDINKAYGRILADTVFIIMQDIILYNKTVKLNGICFYSELFMRTIYKDELIKERQRGNYLDIDYLESNFKAYKPVFCRYDKRDSSISYQTDVIIDGQFNSELTEQINNGKKYYSKVAQPISDYVDKVHNLYPFLKLKDLAKIVNHGIRQISVNLKRRIDVYIKKDNRFIYFGDINLFCKNKPEKYYAKKLRKKFCKLWHLLKPKWDGYYYFGLSEQEFKLYFKPTRKQKKEGITNVTKNNKKFSFLSDKLLIQSPDIAYLYYRKNKYLARVKCNQSFGLYRYIRSYLELTGVELYEFKNNLKLEDLTPKNHKYKILCQDNSQ